MNKRRTVEPVAVEPTPEFDITPVHVDVHRVVGTDLVPHAWAIPLISEDFSGVPVATVTRWMQMWATENQYNFVFTENAIGLAELVFEPRRQSPTVREVFLYCRSADATSEGISIYKHWARWMETSRAGRFECYYGGSRMKEIEKVFPNLQYQKTWYIDA